ncbi:hypothetical protein ACHHYP_09974 [Achlya hypogyna]|uniref:Uncharacterized protein n=1 Tax=Achlya hypogyna TaxID=1202772 RepID=A0A1V9YM37_ACHHY|nr:hypothetical protein ACHHYP_09974 [Achlya hypogyna]
MAELRLKISVAFNDHVSEKTWLGAYAKVQATEDKYFRSMEVDVLADNDEDDPDDNIEDTDHLADALVADDVEFLE